MYLFNRSLQRSNIFGIFILSDFVHSFHTNWIRSLCTLRSQHHRKIYRSVFLHQLSTRCRSGSQFFAGLSHHRHYAKISYTKTYTRLKNVIDHKTPALYFSTFTRTSPHHSRAKNPPTFGFGFGTIFTHRKCAAGHEELRTKLIQKHNRRGRRGRWVLVLCSKICLR